MSRTQGSFHVIDVSFHTVAIDENEFPNTISIDRATPIQNTSQPQDVVQGDKTNPDKGMTPLSETSSKELNQTAKYVVDRFVSHRQSPDRIGYRVGWYGHTTKDDTF